MSSTLYQLKIEANIEQQDCLDAIFDAGQRSSGGTTWTLAFELIDNHPWIDYLGNFVELIRKNFDELERIGISGNDMSIWIIAEYSNQFNLEFSPNTLSKLGELGLTLCISAYEVEDSN